MPELPIGAPPSVTGLGSRLPWLLRLLLALASLVIVIAGVRTVAPVVSTFIVALLLAQVLTPLTLRLTRRRVPLAIAVTLTLLVAFGAIGAVITLVTDSLGELAIRLPEYGRRLIIVRDDAIAFVAARGVDPAKLHGITPLDPKVLAGRAAGYVAVVLSELGHVFFILLITALFLIEFAIVFAKLEKRPRAERTFLTRFRELTGDIQKYVGINAAVNLMSAAALAAIMIAMHIPFIATWMVLVFFLGFIPTLGTILALVPMALVTLLDQGVERALIFTGLYAVVSFVLGEIVKPKLMQHGFEIPILVVFMSLVFWNFILGPVGIVLAVPLTIATRRLLKEFSRDVAEIVAR